MLGDGIGIEGVASEIGALGRMRGPIELKRLVAGLCYRFGAEEWEARIAISRAVEVGVVLVTDGFIDLVR